MRKRTVLSGPGAAECLGGAASGPRSWEGVGGVGTRLKGRVVAPTGSCGAQGRRDKIRRGGRAKWRRHLGSVEAEKETGPGGRDGSVGKERGFGPLKERAAESWTDAGGAWDGAGGVFRSIRRVCLHREQRACLEENWPGGVCAVCGMARVTRQGCARRGTEKAQKGVWFHLAGLKGVRYAH